MLQGPAVTFLQERPSDHSYVDDAYAALIDEATRGLLKEGRPATQGMLDDDVTGSMLWYWSRRSRQQAAMEDAEMAGLLVPVAHGPTLVQLLQSQPDRPAKADPPQRGKHVGPRASLAAMVWIQAVMQTYKLLLEAAEELGTTYNGLKAELLCMDPSGDSYDGIWRLLRPAFRKNPLLVVDYRSLQLLIKAVAEAFKGANTSADATIAMSPEQIVNTVADVVGLPKEWVVMRSGQAEGHEFLVQSICRTKELLDYDTQTAAGCYRSVVHVPM